MIVENIQARRSRRLTSVSRLLVVLALGVALAACNKDPEPTNAAAADTAAAPTVAPETVISSRVSAMSADELREAARAAYADNRLYAPAGNNAVEYYLALRDKAPGDAAVSSALIDLLPMTVIATEQSVNRDDFAEAQRLAALLAKAEPQHPALDRLKTSIADRQEAAIASAKLAALTAEEQAAKQLALEQQRLADQKKQQEVAMRALAAPPSAPASTAASKPAVDSQAEQAAAEQRAADQRAADQRAAEQRAAQALAAQKAAARPTAADLRAVSTPPPEFPREAYRAGKSGEVQIEFTVGVNGSVTEARVVSSSARVFDRAALNAVRSWRFQPISAPVTTRRTIGFNPG